LAVFLVFKPQGRVDAPVYRREFLFMRLGLAGAVQHCESGVRLSREALRWIGRQFLSPRRFVDAAWYSRRYSIDRPVDAYRHFMKQGWKLGYQPNPFFDVAWYRNKYGCSGNPLLDYIRRGRRNPHPLFDVRWYLRAYPDVAASGIDALLHFLEHGRYERRRPNFLFDPQWYAANYGWQGGGDDPFLHYIEEGAAARLHPHPLFDAGWYNDNNPGALSEGRCALTHFLEEGALNGRSPHPLFDADWYLKTYPDVARAKINPLIHYLRSGASELRDPHPHFQTRWYYAAYPEARETNALLHYRAYGHSRARPNLVFDPFWYRRKYGHLLPDGQPPFEHFLRTGRYVGLQPGPFFDPQTYSAKNLAAVRQIDATALFLDETRRDWGVESPAMRRRLAPPLVISPAAPTKVLFPPAFARSFFSRRKIGVASRRKPRIAVHLHIFYLDLAPKLASSLALMPFPFDLHVTLVERGFEKQVSAIFSRISQLNRLDITCTENRGRDIAPFIVACGEALAEYDFILHLHTKKSPHNRRLSAWLDYLLEQLLGSEENIKSIVDAFESRADLGVLYPVPYAPLHPFMRLGGNASAIESLSARLGVRAEQLSPLLYSSFPSGSMLWMRGTVMRRINRLGLAFEDFPVEAGQDDGTLAHAIERLFPVFASEEGLDTLPFIRGDGAYDENGAWTAPATLECDLLILDHNLGGGASKFFEMALPAYLETNAKVVRLYRDHTLGRSICEEIRENSTRYFILPAGETLGESLRRFRTREVVINSLYGLNAEIGGIIAALDIMKRSTGVVLRLMTHDFLLACPSQHLLDFELTYCGLPPMEDDRCRQCAQCNDNIDPLWRQSFQLTTWRLQSQALVDLCDEIIFFDPSGAEILSRVLEIPPRLRKIATQSRAGALRGVEITNRTRPTIGILGTLTYVKGVNVVNELAAYIRRNALDAEAVVIGDARAAIDPSVRVHGAYDAASLPDIVESTGVNIVFISSVVPETYCYTLSEAMDMSLPVVCFDLGAQANRLRCYERGRILSDGAAADEIYSTLSDCWRRFVAPAREEVAS
jgi:glycosyltransferase involved in cell wall biosynthesis